MSKASFKLLGRYCWHEYYVPQKQHSRNVCQTSKFRPAWLLSNTQQQLDSMVPSYRQASDAMHLLLHKSGLHFWVNLGQCYNKMFMGKMVLPIQNITKMRKWYSKIIIRSHLLPETAHLGREVLVNKFSDAHGNVNSTRRVTAHQTLTRLFQCLVYMCV